MNRRKPSYLELWFILGIIFLVGCGPSNYEAAECLFVYSSGQEIECGYLSVPEDRSREDSPIIKLHVAVIKSQNEKPERDPLVIFHGGPGVVSLDNMYGWSTMFGKYLAHRDLIIFDQRGTGYSQPSLNCPEAEETIYESYAENLTSAEEDARYFDSLRKCQERLTASGIDTSAYTTAANAADVNDLRLALGYSEWNLYGVSYGTRLALTVMRDYPEGVRSAVLDAVYPPEAAKYSELAANGERALNMVFERCEADSDCNQAYPDLDQVFYNLVDQLDKEPVTLHIMRPKNGEKYNLVMNGDRLINTIFDLLYKTDQQQRLPKLIYDLSGGNWDDLPTIIRQDQFFYDYWSEGFYTALECYEEVPFSPKDAIQAANESVNPRFWIALNNIATPDMCKSWGTSPESSIEDQPVVSDIPVLIFNGDNDPITTNIWAKMAAETLKNSQYFEFSGFGHGILQANIDNLACPKKILDAFIDDPVSPVDGSCISEYKPNFVVID